MPEEGAVSELDTDVVGYDMHETECLMCVTLIEWLREAWPEEHLEELPDMRPHERKPGLKVHSGQTEWMPFCDMCRAIYMQAMSVFHAERLQREGQEQTPLKARVNQQIVAPTKQIVLPGQPGFKAP